VPKLLSARLPKDAEEERKIRKLAGSRHAPGDWINRARIVFLSWQGLRTARIAQELGCHPKTVRQRLHRFNAEGIDGLGDRPRTGRRLRLTELERSKIIALVAKNPPGKLLTEPDGVLGAEDETKAAYWTLDTLAESAWEIGIEIGRSQVRRILLREGVRWRNTRPWAQSSDPEFAPKGRGSSNSTPTRRRTPQWSAWTSSALLLRVPFLRLRDGRRTDTASKRLWNTALRPRQGVGLWRSASGGRQVAHVHLALTELQRLPEVVGEDRAGRSAGSHLRNRRQSQNPQERYGEAMARRTSQDRACVHPEGCGVAEPHRGVVAAFAAAGASRSGLR
jgi:transposase